MESIKNFLHLEEQLPSISPHILFSFGPFSFAPSTIMIVFFIILFLSIAIWMGTFSLFPNKKQSLTEIIIEKLFNFLNSIISDEKKTKEVFPYIASVFFFILISNFIFIIPGILNFTYHGHHLATVPTTDFNTTFALAFASIILINISAIRHNGFFKHLSHYFQFAGIVKGFKKGLGAGFLSIINFFVGLIEVVGEMAKVVSLSLRLFGNIFAHEVLAIIIIGSMSIVLPSIWMGFGMLVGFVQAVVFTSLITVYFSLYHKHH